MIARVSVHDGAEEEVAFSRLSARLRKFGDDMIAFDHDLDPPVFAGIVGGHDVGVVAGDEGERAWTIDNDRMFVCAEFLVHLGLGEQGDHFLLFLAGG